jgi:hypothetical protein
VEEMIKAFKSFEDSLFEEGKAEGRAEGEVRGKALGAVESLREALRDVMIDRFGELSRELVQKIDAIDDVERLKAALRQVHRIDTLEELQL